MTSIKDYVVRVTKKGKKRGRPSKAELFMSRMVSEEFMKPNFQKEMNECVHDTLMYGTGIFDSRKALKGQSNG